MGETLGMIDGDDAFVEFCHLNPARTTTDSSDLESWLTERKIPFRHSEGPAGDTVFHVPREAYARAVELWADYRGSEDYILRKHAPWLTRPRNPSTGRPRGL
jgi:hypothetical protein